MTVEPMRILFLDDEPWRHAEFARMADGHSVVHAWRVDEATALLDGTAFDLCCLDNDLETEAFLREGLEVACHIARTPASRRPRRVLIHSRNEVRAEQMYEVLRPLYAGNALRRIPFGEFSSVGNELS